MKQVTALNRDNVRELAHELEAVVKAWAESRGLSVEYRGGSFDPPLKFTPKFELKIKATADGLSPEQVEWKQWAALFGMNVDDFGATFTAAGTTYRIVGVKPRTVRPIIAARSDGKRFVFTATDVKRFLGR
jgi:hypothetical protein